MANEVPTTSVGSYPVAPDTSINAFLSANPGLDSRRHRRWLEGYYNTFTPMSKFSKINQQYESWKLSEMNKYDSLLKNWEAAYKSPYTQSELLEAAGYNRNWLQGASNSAVDTNTYSATPSEHQPQFVDRFSSGLGFAMQGIQAYTAIKDTMASADLKEAQAEQIRELTPYKLAQKFFDVMPQYSDWYGFDPGSQMSYFEASPGHGITMATPNSGAFALTGRNFQLQLRDLTLQNMRLRKEYLNFSNKEKKYVYDNILPIQKEITDLQRQYFQGNLDLLDYQKRAAKVRTEVVEKFSMKGAQQQFILGYVNAALKGVELGIDAFTSFKRLGLQEDIFEWGKGMDILKETGDMTGLGF